MNFDAKDTSSCCLKIKFSEASTLSVCHQQADQQRIIHSLRVFHQVQEWLGHSLDAVKYGWERVDGRLHPKTTDVGIAPESALKVLKCSCNKFQIDCTQYCACSEECCSNKTDEDEDEDEG